MWYQNSLKSHLKDGCSKCEIITQVKRAKMAGNGEYEGEEDEVDEDEDEGDGEDEDAEGEGDEDEESWIIDN